MKHSLALPLALLALPAVAQPLADLAAIDREVADFIGAAPGASDGAARPVDRRLRLAACVQPLALSWYGARRDTVSVVCPAPGGWTIYVPLAGDRASPAAPVVERGDGLSVTAEGEGFAVSQPGEALEAGAVGAWIRVRTTGAVVRTLRARVIAPGLVGIALP